MGYVVLERFGVMKSKYSRINFDVVTGIYIGTIYHLLLPILHLLSAIDITVL